MIMAEATPRATGVSRSPMEVAWFVHPATIEAVKVVGPHSQQELPGCRHDPLCVDQQMPGAPDDAPMVHHLELNQIYLIGVD